MADEVRKIAKLKVRRGPEANLPTLDEGEPGLALDTERIFFGTGKKNIEVAKKTEVTQMKTDLTSDINKVDGKLTQANRQTQTLSHGMNIVNSEYNTPLDVQIEGRTLASLGNTNLEDGKYYVLADKKTKVKAFKDDTWKVGVAKFQRDVSATTKANFESKLTGSNTENPHTIKTKSAGTLDNPSTFSAEWSQAGYDLTKGLDGRLGSSVTSTSGHLSQHLFSFNIVDHIERKAGVIPKTTLADKIQWVKDNVENIACNWWGKGSGTAGSKANLREWSVSSGAWVFLSTHSSTSVTKLSLNARSTSPENYKVKDVIDSAGFSHYLANAESSNGTVASTIETDYIELEITLNPTAQLIKRPIFSRIANFEGKISGSTVENPHVVRRGTGSTTLMSPGTGLEEGQGQTDNLRALDGAVNNWGGQNTAGAMAQHLFSFNLIEEVERNLGKIPKSTTADKVQWVKDNVDNLRVNWYGFGSGPGGNRVTLKVWLGTGWAWNGFTHTSPNVTKISGPSEWAKYPGDQKMLDSAGFIHFLAYAEPSDGTTSSTVTTDYIDLEVALKPEAELWHPSVPLFEVPVEEYNKVLVDWNEAEVLKRYPRVQGVQHVQNPYVMAEGENLLPPFSEWSIHANAKVLAPYELELNGTSQYQGSAVTLVLPENTQFTINAAAYEVEIGVNITAYDASNAVLGTLLNTGLSGAGKSFTTPAKTKFVKVTFFNISANRLSVFKEVSLTMGTARKPFVPRNPSYLLAEAKIGAIGTVRDRLYFEDGVYKVRKAIEKDVVMDGKTDWGLMQTYPGFKRFSNTKAFPSDPGTDVFEESLLGVKSNGSRLKGLPRGVSLYAADQFILQSFASGGIKISVSNAETGFSESYSPISEEIRAYFNGWRVKTADANGKPTAWVSTVDGTDSPTQTLNYVKDNYAGDYTPYKLSYVLPSSVYEVVKTEGGVTAPGQTLVEVGSGVILREKVVPYVSGSYAHINYRTASASILSKKTVRVLGIYKDSSLDLKWTVEKSGGSWKVEGANGAYIRKEDYDPKASYYVTYIVLDLPQFTGPALNVRTTFANNVRSALDDVVARQADQGTMTTLNTNAILDLYIRMKALEGGAK